MSAERLLQIAEELRALTELEEITSPPERCAMAGKLLQQALSFGAYRDDAPARVILERHLVVDGAFGFYSDDDYAKAWFGVLQLRGYGHPLDTGRFSMDEDSFEKIAEELEAQAMDNLAEDNSQPVRTDKIADNELFLGTLETDDPELAACIIYLAEHRSSGKSDVQLIRDFLKENGKDPDDAVKWQDRVRKSGDRGKHNLPKRT